MVFVIRVVCNAILEKQCATVCRLRTFFSDNVLQYAQVILPYVKRTLTSL